MNRHCQRIENMKQYVIRTGRKQGWTLVRPFSGGHRWWGYTSNPFPHANVEEYLIATRIVILHLSLSLLFGVKRPGDVTETSPQLLKMSANKSVTLNKKVLEPRTNIAKLHNLQSMEAMTEYNFIWSNLITWHIMATQCSHTQWHHFGSCYWHLTDTIYSSTHLERKGWGRGIQLVAARFH